MDNQCISKKTMVAKIRHFVFGYGSLICPESRAITNPDQANKVATPVVVHNVERIFSKRTHRGMTAMGVRFVEGVECIGVLLPVTNKELLKFDNREKGYGRMPLVLADVHPVPFLGEEHYEEEAHSVFLDAKSEEDTAIAKKRHYQIRIWVYVQKKLCPPDADHPIVQSYVDIMLRGCLSISPEFAKEFIETTKGWHPDEFLEDEDDEDDEKENGEDDGDDDDDDIDAETEAEYEGNETDDNDEVDDENIDEGFWVDDRDAPVYIRGDRKWSRRKAKLVDNFLRKYQPEHFASRVVLDDEDGDKDNTVVDTPVSKKESSPVSKEESTASSVGTSIL
jgi:cation transport regulator ChaC